MYSVVPNQYKDNLITVDILCHGVTNKKVIDSYIKAEENRHNKKIVDYKFRMKNDEIGWNKSSKMQLFFEDGTSYYEKNVIDAFFTAFNKNVILRESCFSCDYCGLNRISDFTIADFWGVSDDRATQQEQKDGISLLICNSNKSKKLLYSLKNSMKIVKIDKEEAIPFNKALVKANERPKERDVFFELLNQNKDFIKITKRIYWKKSLKENIKRVLGPKFIKKIKEGLHK